MPTLMNLDRDLFPVDYESKHNVRLLPTFDSSVTATLERFLKKNLNRFISYKATWDDTGTLIPIGTLLVWAYWNGDDECKSEFLFFVNAERYYANLTPFGYVIDELVDEFRKRAD